MPTPIKPLVPYLFLPADTCEATADFLPITLASDIGLYKWNTGDPAYQKVLLAPTYLGLVFQSAGSSDGNSVSKSLSSYFTSPSKRLLYLHLKDIYFMLAIRPDSAKSRSFSFVGKVFLQAAFIGMN